MEEQSERQYFQDIKDRLDSVGPGFCLAKWNQVTIHLGTGLNHSCHHPTAHKISEAEVLVNPTHLHNTQYKKRCWREMLTGKRPKECDYCWNIEDNSKEFSDRVLKSSEPWAWPTFDSIVNSDWTEDYYPRYVEISFSNRCNFKCLYCSPNFSSRWNNEAKEFGPQYLVDGTVLNAPIDLLSEKRCEEIETNPLVKAFWKWWPDLFRKVHSFRLTGGEPLLVSESYQIMEYILEHFEEAENLKFFSINTNLGMSDEQFEKFLSLYQKLAEKIPEIALFTSIESGKAEAEYTRFGLNYGKFWNRIRRLIREIPRLTVTLMATYNILSVDTYLDTIQNAYKAKCLDNTREKGIARVYGTSFMLDTSYLRHPSFLDLRVGDYEKVKKKLQECVEYAEDHRWLWTDWEYVPGFSEMEIEKIRRLLDYLETAKDINLEVERQKLLTFLQEEDRRRNTNFREIWNEESCLGV